MASLTGKTISSTYDGLLKTTDNDVLNATAKEITDGLGNGSGVALDTGGNVTIQGNFQALGGVKDTSGDLGTSGQILLSTGAGTNWADAGGAVDSVNAGTGISVDVTTGNVTVTNTGDLDTTTDNGATTTNSITVGGLHIDSTGAVEMPTGTDAQRPTPVTGMFRFNTTDTSFEGYDGSAWGAIGGGATNFVDTETGDGSTTVYTLSNAVASENDTTIYISGVYQSKLNYTVSGTTLTFSTAPPNGTAIEIMSAVS